MPTTRPPYPSEFRRQIVELVRSGPSIVGLPGEFEPSANTIRKWVQRAQADEEPDEGSGTVDQQEIQRLRRENRRLRQEREISKEAAAWCALETGSVPPKPSDS